MTTLIIVTITINMLIFFLNHPMSMGMLIIVQTMLFSMITGMVMKSFWMSYILTISILSGMLVLFIYMASLASNEKFKNSMNMWMMSMMMLVLSSVMMYFEEKLIYYMDITPNIPSMIKESMFLVKLLNMEYLYIVLMMVMYLLFTMIVSVHLTNINEGPLRMKSYE